MPMARRFWIEFDRDHGSVLWWISLYAGVTGFDEQDCLAMVADLLPRRRGIAPGARYYGGRLTGRGTSGEPSRSRSPGVARGLIPASEP